MDAVDVRGDECQSALEGKPSGDAVEDTPATAPPVSCFLPVLNKMCALKPCVCVLPTRASASVLSMIPSSKFLGGAPLGFGIPRREESLLSLMQ